jgi:SSS family transporter
MLADGILSRADFIVFFGSLLAVMAIGLWVGRRERTAQDYFLAGKDTPWWAVAGSIFGSNVSANHMVGMMAVGFTAGFVISHLEITAIAGLLLLCYFFLPIYRKLHVYTLSDYLGRRYDDRSRVGYSVIMLIIIVLVMMLPAFYLGSRAVNILMVDEGEILRAQYSSQMEYGQKITLEFTSDTKERQQQEAAKKAVMDVWSKLETFLKVTSEKGVTQENYKNAWETLYPKRGPPSFEEAQYDIAQHPAVIKWESLRKVEVDQNLYIWGIVIMALVTGVYTVVGGLRAVIVTDVIQSVLILLGMLIVAWCTFNHDLIASWETMVKYDQNHADVQGLVEGKNLLHLYKPSSDPDFPWTGVLSGLLVLHFYYWGANQFIVQRALAARSLGDARTGIITAGFFKLLIPFVSIGTGIAAYYLFQQLLPGVKLDADTAFPMLMREVVSPLLIPGLVGLVAAGLIGAILSSVDSMMNSAATLITFDMYKRFINPKAQDEQLVRMGKLIIIGLVMGSAALTIFIFDPNTKEPFMKYVITHQSRLVAGIVAAFLLGMLWSGATAAGGFAAIITGVVVSYGLGPLYAEMLGTNKEIARHFGTELNPFHSVFVAFICAMFANFVVSRMTQWIEIPRKCCVLVMGVILGFFCVGIYEDTVTSWFGGNVFLLHGTMPYIICALFATGFYWMFATQEEVDEEKSRMTWIGLGITRPADLQHFGMKLLGSLLVYAFLATMMTGNLISPMAAAIVASVWTFMMFLDSMFKVVLAAAVKGRAYSLLREDRFWAGLLASCAIFMMFYFY